MSKYVYTEQDMQIAQNALEKLQRDKENAMAVIWALVQKSDGKVSIDQRSLMVAHEKGNVLSTWESPSKLLFYIEASRETDA